MLGIAVGNIGIPYNDFCGLTPDEFSHIYKAFSERQEAQYKDDWERMRMLACICIQPYAKKGLTPHSLLPLPWDGRRMPRNGKRKTEIPSKQEAMKRLKEALKKTKGG